MRDHLVIVLSLAACLVTVLGAEAGVLNVTLQLTTPDVLPVSAVLQAASRVWDIEQGNIHVVSATAEHAASEKLVQPHSRALLHSKLKLHLDFAKMKEDNPSLLTLKDFIMSSNQAPETESDIQHLLQAFAEFKQGELKSTKSVQPSTQTQSSSALSSSGSESASALHPHLLFLKTGGGSTVSQPKHQLTMQQLQTLADSGSTSEGLLPVQTKTPSPSTNTVPSKQQGPLGSANIMLGTQDESFHRVASLFTPQNDEAIARALQILEDNDDEPVSQALFSSLVQDPEEDDLLAALQMPYDLDEPLADTPVSLHSLKSPQHDHDIKVDPMMSLSWLDEADLHDMGKTVSAAQKMASEESTSDAGAGPAPARSVLLTIALSIASANVTALQADIVESISDRQLQQELDRQGYAMVQLDAMFADEGVFSSETDVVSAETADPVQGQAVEQVKVSVRTVVKRHLVSGAAAHKDATAAATEAHMASGDSMRDEYKPELLICVAGFVAAFAAVVLGMYKYSVSRAGMQAQKRLDTESGTTFWLCGNNPLRQPLIPKHAMAEEAC